jgi:ActD protein
VFLTGDFRQKEATAQAIGQLKSNGFGLDELDVFSDEPLNFERGVLERPSRMSFAVVTGAITLCLLTVGFVYFTQYNYPLITGGMPLFSFWATGVVFYELTMLGAILTAFGWFLRESGLLRRGRGAPVPAAKPGFIYLRVRCTPNQADEIRALLKRAGANDITEVRDAA